MTHRQVSRALLPILILVAASTIGCNSSSSSPTAPPLETTSAARSLNAATANAVNLAIEDEYKARATYDAIVAEIGNVAPFVSIRNAENSHVNALVVLLDSYGLPVPADPWPGTIDAPDTLQEACQAGVVAELENIAMYDDFFAYVTEDDVIDVFNRLRSASLDKHLPAFERCS